MAYVLNARTIAILIFYCDKDAAMTVILEGLQA